MSATVIDELVITLGLDPKKFTDGQKAALADFKKTSEEFRKGGQQLEEQTKSLTDFFGAARSGALKLFAVFTGAAGVAAFTENTIRSTAAVGRLAHGVSLSVNEITKLQGLVRVFGGDASEATQQVVTLSDAVADMKLGQISPLITMLRSLSASGGVQIDPNSGPIGILGAVAENLKNIREKYGSDVAGDFARRLGFSSALYESLIPGQEKFLENLAKIKGLTEDDAKAALDLQQRWDALGVSVDNAAKKGVISSLDWLKPLAHELFAVPFSESQPWDALFGTGKYAHKQDAKTTTGAFTSQTDKEAFIRAEAVKRGINPDIAMWVARHEGFNSFSGDNGTSFGAFQLHVTPGGRGGAVGDQFRSRTGLNPSDPANERAGILFALDDIRRNGWSAYHGAANSGIAPWRGIERGSGTSTSSVFNINGPININAGQNADGAQMASSFTSALKRQAMASQANGGQN